MRSLLIDRSEAAYYARWGVARLPPERNPATLPTGPCDEAMLAEWRAKRAAMPQRSSKPTAKARRAKA